MKPRPQPTYDLVREGRAEAVLTGVGMTLLVTGTGLLGAVLLVVAKWYQVLRGLQPYMGRGPEEFRALTFLHQAGGVVFLGVLVVTVLFGVLLSRTPRPGVALTVQGVLLLLFVAVLVVLVVSESETIVANLLRAFAGLSKMPLRVP